MNLRPAVKKDKNAYCPLCGAYAGATTTGACGEGKTRAEHREGTMRLYVCLGLPGAAMKCGWTGKSPRWKD